MLGRMLSRSSWSCLLLTTTALACGGASTGSGSDGSTDGSETAAEDEGGDEGPSGDSGGDASGGASEAGPGEGSSEEGGGTSTSAGATGGEGQGESEGGGGETILARTGITIAEVITGIRINLGVELLASCELFDADRDSRVSVEELVGAVNGALRGCARSV